MFDNFHANTKIQKPFFCVKEKNKTISCGTVYKVLSTTPPPRTAKTVFVGLSFRLFYWKPLGKASIKNKKTKTISCGPVCKVLSTPPPPVRQKPYLLAFRFF